MRWDRLFTEIEASAADDELVERDALVEDLREGELAATTWRQLTGGRVCLEVAALGRIEGDLLSANEVLLHLQTAQAHVLINPVSVMAIVHTTKRAGRQSAVSQRLGWPTVMRMLQRDQDRVRVCRTDASTVSGLIDLVGADFVRVRDDAGNAPLIPLVAITAVSCPR